MMKRLLGLLAAVVTATVVLPVALSAAGPTDQVEEAAVASQEALRTGVKVQTVDSIPPPPTTAPVSPANDRLQQVLDLVNAERTSRGIAPLRYNATLSLAAQRHSEDQAARNLLTHTGSNGSNPGQRITAVGYRFSAWAENAAAGYGSASAVMSGWMGSTGHRVNILNSNYTEIGLGIAYTSNGYPYWTQVFARPKA